MAMRHRGQGKRRGAAELAIRSLMPPLARRAGHHRSRRGVAMLEMVLILPVLTLLAFAMIEAARMCIVSQLLTNAAREGCRVAITNGKTSTDVTTRIDASFTAARITPALVTRTLSPSAVDATKSNDPISLTLSVNFNNVNWFPSPFFFKSRTITAQAVMMSERP